MSRRLIIRGDAMPIVCVSAKIEVFFRFGRRLYGEAMSFKGSAPDLNCSASEMGSNFNRFVGLGDVFSLHARVTLCVEFGCSFNGRNKVFN